MHAEHAEELRIARRVRAQAHQRVRAREAKEVDELAQLESLPEPSPSVAFIAPFDSLLWDTTLLERLFAFDFVWEGFFKPEKRRWGYYVLPILEGEKLIGRLDPKLHRERGVLEVKNLWWEPGVRDSMGRRASLETALDRLVRLVGAERWEMT